VLPYIINFIIHSFWHFVMPSFKFIGNQRVLLTFMVDYIQCFKFCSKSMNKRHFKMKYTWITLKHLHVNERVLLMTLIWVCLYVWHCYHNQKISQLTAWPTLLKLQKTCDILYMCMGIDVQYQVVHLKVARTCTVVYSDILFLLWSWC